MKIILLLLSFSLMAQSQIDYIEFEEDSDFQHRGLSIEAITLSESVENAQSTLFGPAILYSLSEYFTIGARALLAVGAKEYESHYSFQVLGRSTLIRSNADVFLELSAGVSQLYREIETTLVGSALGLNYSLNPQINIGGLAGFDYFIDSVGPNFYPKVGITASVNL